MPPKKQHHKTQSSEISTQALMNYLQSREQLKSSSPTLQLDGKMLQRQLSQQFSPVMKSSESVRMSKAQQSILNILKKEDRNKGFLSPKVVGSKKSHLKTQPQSVKKQEIVSKIPEDYFKKSIQPHSATNVESSLKQRVELAIQEMKQRQQQKCKQGHQKTNSACDPFQSAPLVEKIKTNRKQSQDMLTIIVSYKTFRQKYVIDISINKIQWLVDFVRAELLKQFPQIQFIGIRTTNISISVDYILSRVDRQLSLLSKCPYQPLIVEPILGEQTENRGKMTLRDFDFIRCIGMGGFSKVYLVRDKRSGQFYAMKLIEKKPILDQKKQNIIQNERDIMANLRHPFLVKLQYAFESRKYLVFVLEYCQGGELFYLLRRVKRMSEEEAFFYFAQICLGMKHLHDHNIIYRDIKPENILIDFDGHVRIADFGLSKYMNQDIAYSFCGSPEYMAPEMLLKSGHTLQLDLYCLGALLYELVTGLPPFYSRKTDEIYSRILTQKLTFPCTLSPLIKDLLSGLLAKNPKKRIDSIDNLLKHPWMCQYGEQVYQEMLEKKIHPPFKPDWYGVNFDEEEFGRGESEFLQAIKPLQLSFQENNPKDISLKSFYYSPLGVQESTGGTKTSETQRQKTKRMNTVDDENCDQLYFIQQLRLQTDQELKRKLHQF